MSILARFIREKMLERVSQFHGLVSAFKKHIFQEYRDVDSTRWLKNNFLNFHTETWGNGSSKFRLEPGKQPLLIISMN